MKTLIVGDIHGCIDELLDLVEAAGLREEDRLISVGDIVNKGPAPQEVFEYLAARPNTTVLLGNHEIRHIEAGEDGAALPERISRAQFSPESYRAFLVEVARLPLSMELPEALVTHGYFEPGLPPARQKRDVLLGLDRARSRLKERGLWPWYDFYDFSKPIVVGHKAYREDGRPLVYPGRVYAIDTKCCEGLALTGVMLPGFEIVAVPSRRNHWAAVQTAWRDFEPAPGARFTLPPSPPRRLAIAMAARTPPGPPAEPDRPPWWAVGPMRRWWRQMGG